MRAIGSRYCPDAFTLALAILCLFAAAKPILSDTIDPDFFWHIRVAEQLQTHGVAPIVDDLSFASMREPWTPYSWLAELAMKGAWDFAGVHGVVGAHAILNATLFALIALTCIETVRRVDGTVTLAPPRCSSIVLAVAIAIYLSLPYLSFRPATMALVMLALARWLIARDERLEGRSRAIWLLIPLTAVLVNVHLTAIVVPIWAACMLIGSLASSDLSAVRRAGLLTVGCAGSLFATPMGGGFGRVIAHYATRDVMVDSSVIAEMQSVFSGTLGIAAVALVGVILLIVLRNRTRFTLATLLIACVGLILMMKLGRFAPIFAMSALPLFAASLDGFRGRVLTHRAAVTLMSAVLALGVVRLVLAFPGGGITLDDWANRLGSDVPGYPVEASDYVIRSIPHSSGKIINEFNWGGYLAMKMPRSYRVLMDGRTQLYSQGFWESTYLGTNGDRRRFLANLKDADAAILPAQKSIFDSPLRQLGWKEVHRDDFAVVLIPPAPSTASTPRE